MLTAQGHNLDLRRLDLGTQPRPPLPCRPGLIDGAALERLPKRRQVSRVDHGLVAPRYQVVACDAVETGIDFQHALGLFTHREQT